MSAILESICVGAICASLAVMATCGQSKKKHRVGRRGHKQSRVVKKNPASMTPIDIYYPNKDQWREFEPDEYPVDPVAPTRGQAMLHTPATHKPVPTEL